jgi:hypothetical protein
MTSLSCCASSVMFARMVDDDNEWLGASDEQLIAWHNEFDVTAQALADREGVEVKWLHRQWERLRRMGLIPRGGRSGMTMTTPVNHDGDGRPTVGWFEDPLLERLIKVHGEPRWDLVDVRVKKAKGGRRHAG